MVDVRITEPHGHAVIRKWNSAIPGASKSISAARPAVPDPARLKRE